MGYRFEMVIGLFVCDHALCMKTNSGKNIYVGLASGGGSED